MYRIVAHVDNGFDYMGNIRKLEQAVLTELKGKIDHLKSLKEWEGQEIVVV